MTGRFPLPYHVIARLRPGNPARRPPGCPGRSRGMTTGGGIPKTNREAVP